MFPDFQGKDPEYATKNQLSWIQFCKFVKIGWPKGYFFIRSYHDQKSGYNSRLGQRDADEI